MRVAVVAVVLAALGCSGRPATPPVTVANTAVVQREAWTLARALATFPAETDLIVTWDNGRLRRAPIVAPHWDRMMELTRGAAAGAGVIFDVCPALSSIDATFVIAFQAGAAGELAVRGWFLGLGRAYVDCALRTAAERPDRVAVRRRAPDVVEVHSVPDGLVMTVRLLDDDTLVFHTGSRIAADAATVAALAEPAASPFTSPELAWLAGVNPEVWLVFDPKSPSLGMLRQTLLAAGIGVVVRDRVEIEARGRAPDAARAQVMADSLQSALEQATQMQLVDDMAVEAREDEVEVMLVLERATVEKIAKLVAARWPGMGTSTTPPPVLIPTP